MSMRAGLLLSTSACFVDDLADSQRSYSSIWDNNAIGTGHARGRLDSVQGWSSMHNAVGQYMQLTLSTVSSVCGAITLGRADCCGQFVSSFKAQASTDCTTFVDVDGGQVYGANWDQTTRVQVCDLSRYLSACVASPTHSSYSRSGGIIEFGPVRPKTHLRAWLSRSCSTPQ